MAGICLPIFGPRDKFCLTDCGFSNIYNIKVEKCMFASNPSSMFGFCRSCNDVHIDFQTLRKHTNSFTHIPIHVILIVHEFRKWDH